MNTNELTLGQIKELFSLFNGEQKQQPKPQGGPWVIGEKYFILTVSMFYTGKLTAIYEDELVLSEAAWIPDTGRFNEFLANPEKANDIEPFQNDAIIGRGSIVAATVIPSLVRSVK